MKKLCMVLVCVLILAGCSNSDETDTNNEEKDKGYVFVVNGVEIGMNQEASGLITSLGEYDNYYEAASCAFEGLDKQYFYQGFEVDTYPVEEKDYISMVYIDGETLPTKEGVKVGDTTAKVKEVYGEDYKEDSGTLVYTSGKSKLSFYMESDTVTAIEYAAITS